MQTVERPDPKSWSVAASQICADIKRILWNIANQPHTTSFVSFQLLIEYLCLLGGQLLAKNMLSQGMGPFGAVKGRKKRSGGSYYAFSGR